MLGVNPELQAYETSPLSKHSWATPSARKLTFICLCKHFKDIGLSSFALVLTLSCGVSLGLVHTGVDRKYSVIFVPLDWLRMAAFNTSSRTGDTGWWLTDHWLSCVNLWVCFSALPKKFSLSVIRNNLMTGLPWYSFLFLGPRVGWSFLALLSSLLSHLETLWLLSLQMFGVLCWYLSVRILLLRAPKTCAFDHLRPKASNLGSFLASVVLILVIFNSGSSACMFHVSHDSRPGSLSLLIVENLG